ncbi:MAG: VanW family protein [Herbinix sp.]|nr:VanW family protein [Herbinix sp.]
MSRTRILISAIFLLSISFLYAGKPLNASAAENTNICNGVYIDDVDISGMTKDDAQAAVDEYINGLKSKGVAITVGDNVVYATMGDLGYTTDPDDNIDEALNLGKTGNLIKRYKDLKDIEQGSVVLPLTFSYDESKIKNIVSTDVSAFNIAPVNASVAIKNGELVYTDHVVGSKINIDETTKLIVQAVKNWDQQDLVVDAVVDEDMPLYTTDIVKQCDTVLGSYTTEYASSAEGRAANLANGARLINNAVLYPSDEFSAYDYLSPFTEENGYFVAGAYLQGKVIDSVGGGACQVTTTLYNAVLKAELEVTQRQPHSMVISYVDLSRDAAIAGTSKNFKFKNNTNVPILIQATTKDRKITFKIWGKETRDTENRKIEFVTKVLSQTAPPKDIITKDPTQPTTYRDVTTPAHTGYKAELYKVVYENGVEVSRSLVNKSNYQAAARCITVGTKVVKEEPSDTTDTDTTKEDPSKTDTNSNTNTNTNKNKDTNSKTDAKIESQSNTSNNLTNPDGQLQGDLWDPAWDLDDTTQE